VLASAEGNGGFQRIPPEKWVCGEWPIKGTASTTRFTPLGEVKLSDIMSLAAGAHVDPYDIPAPELARAAWTECAQIHELGYRQRSGRCDKAAVHCGKEPAEIFRRGEPDE
jgi:hypothetical protein